MFGCSLSSTVRQSAPPSVDGLTHAIMVIADVTSSEAESGTVTRSFTPSNESALPKRPAGVHAAPLIAPALPRPEASATAVPAPSLNPYAATGVPAGGGAVAIVSVTGTVRGEPCAPVAATVTLPVYVPAARPAMLADTFTVPAPVPLAGAAWSHGWSVAAVHVSVPPPLLETASGCAAGLAPPAVAENDRLAGDTCRVGPAGGGCTVRVTSICFGEPSAPGAVTVTVPVCVPGARPAIRGATPIVPGDAPLVGDSWSHGTLALAVQFSACAPSWLTARSRGAGSAPPDVAVNDSVPGVTASVGGGGGPPLPIGVVMSAWIAAGESARL